MKWNTQQYLKFSQQRLIPAQDLLNRISLDAPQIIYDLGCGTGQITCLIAQRWPKAKVIGIDSSPEMLAEARKLSTAIQWEQLDINAWEPAELPDLIFSNSVLHWLGNHHDLFQRLTRYLKPGGIFAVQMPNNFDQATHTCAIETVEHGAWKKKLYHLLRSEQILSPRVYYELLAPLAMQMDIWETIYYHLLDNKQSIVEWTKGTFLKQFLDELETSEQTQFLQEYTKRIEAAYPAFANGKTLLPFRRLFLFLLAKRG